MIDLTEQKFGRLTVLKDSMQRHKTREIMWLCICSCNNQSTVRGTSLRRGLTKSCGCLEKEVWRKIGLESATHGDSTSRLYQVWQGMKSRCCYHKDINYKNYGAKGIRVCDEWKNDYPNFKFWAILSGYEQHLTIDRIDSKGNYEPNNCQWLTRSENVAKSNRENPRWITRKSIERSV